MGFPSDYFYMNIVFVVISIGATPLEEGYEIFVVNETDSARDEELIRNANIQQTFTLNKGASKTFTFTVNGGFFIPIIIPYQS